MARHKSFGNQNPYADREPVTFEIYSETFTCRPAVQGAELLRFGKDAVDNPNEAVLNFFQICMNEAEFIRFKDLMEDPERIIDVETLGQIAGFLVSEYSSRPTGPSSSSTSGPEPTGRTSGRRR